MVWTVPAWLHRSGISPHERRNAGRAAEAARRDR